MLVSHKKLESVALGYLPAKPGLTGELWNLVKLGAEQDRGEAGVLTILNLL